MCRHLRRCKSALNRPQLSLFSILASIRFRHSPVGKRDRCWAGLPPFLVHMQVPVHRQFTHTLIFLKQYPISSGSWLFRTEKRSVACHQYNIYPCNCLLLNQQTKVPLRISATAFKRMFRPYAWIHVKQAFAFSLPLGSDHKQLWTLTI